MFKAPARVLDSRWRLGLSATRLCPSLYPLARSLATPSNSDVHAPPRSPVPVSNPNKGARPRAGLVSHNSSPSKRRPEKKTRSPKRDHVLGLPELDTLEFDDLPIPKSSTKPAFRPTSKPANVSSRTTLLRYSPGSSWGTRTGIINWLAKLELIIYTEAKAEVERAKKIFGGFPSLQQLIHKRMAIPLSRIHSVRSTWGSTVKIDVAVPTNIWLSGAHAQETFRIAEGVELLKHVKSLPPWTDEWLTSSPPTPPRLKATVISNEYDSDVPTAPAGYTLVTFQVPGSSFDSAKLSVGDKIFAIQDFSILPYLRLEKTLERMAKSADVSFYPMVSTSYRQLSILDPADADKKDNEKGPDGKPKKPLPLTPLQKAVLTMTEYLLPPPSAPLDHGSATEAAMAKELPLPPMNELLNAGQLAVIRDCVQMDNAVSMLGTQKQAKLPAAGQGAGAAGRGEDSPQWAADHLTTHNSADEVLPFRLIHGPPGTGKTHTLVELVLQLALSPRPLPLTKKQRKVLNKDRWTLPPQESRARRVLVTGPSNVAIDVIATRLLNKSAPWAKALAESDVKILRMGLQGKVSDDVSKNTMESHLASVTDSNSFAQQEADGLRSLVGMLKQRVEAATEDHQTSDEEFLVQQGAVAMAEELLHQTSSQLRRKTTKASRTVIKESEVVMCTLTSVHNLVNTAGKFDVLIVDEASQALEPYVLLALQALSAQGTLIMLGDPHQLPPSLSDSTMHPPAGLLPTPKDTLRMGPDGKPMSVVPLSPLRSQQPTAPLQWEHDLNQTLEGDGNRLVLQRASKARALPLTLFERLMKQYPVATSLLYIQYRMSNEIMAFSAQHVYNGQLQAHPSAAPNKLTDLPHYNLLPPTPSHLLGQPFPPTNTAPETNPFESSLYFFDTSFCGHAESSPGASRALNPMGSNSSSAAVSHSFVNDFEAEWVMNHVTELVQRGINPTEMAILTPYRAQATWLKSLLKQRFGPTLACGTLDSAQGIEREVIVLSLVRSNPTRTSGFTADPRRLNVAITRAKRHLAIVGDGHTLSRHPKSLLTKYIDHLRSHAVVRSPDPQTLLVQLQQTGRRRYPRTEQDGSTRDIADGVRTRWEDRSHLDIHGQQRISSSLEDA